ncbi:uncharacterized protein VTP21DRAFT_7305 [Calcarisporiella thermophila]|uniref:uncharacterized protein n=1 Tax=Calcarisporiella thermophila TaxID=911321 RepID=UPI0037447E8C
MQTVKIFFRQIHAFRNFSFRNNPFPRNKRNLFLATPAVLITPFSMSENENTGEIRNKAHHAKGGFENPWPSFQKISPIEFLKGFREFNLTRNLPAAEDKVKIVDINHELLNKPTPGKVQATWLGHACFLVQIDGVNILYDPVFSDRCSPSQHIGPKRYTPPPCKLSELPPIDLVIISHNHYDHLDVSTIEELGNRPRYFVPLGNKRWFESMHINNVEELDWWEERKVQLDYNRQIVVTCTPCQHFTGRGIFDRNKTLWASWCVYSPKTSGKIYFAGDTGYRSVPRGYDEEKIDELPHCPVFKEIGSKKGPFDLAMIPIGAYNPRHLLSPVHCSPEDSVLLHEDIKSKRSLAMHWGTWLLGGESATEPPVRLRLALEKRGHSLNEFSTCNLGETVAVDIGSD